MSGSGSVQLDGTKTPQTIQASDSFSIDAFGRWRVSDPATIFDSKNIFNDPDLASSVENLPLFFVNDAFCQ